MASNTTINSEGESEEEETIIASPDSLVALDCEMVGVGTKKRNSLARCSIVDYHGRVLFDQYIQPRGKVTDYRYRWSGIKPQHLKDAVPFALARKQILSILKDKVIVGHALNFDFKVLKMHRRKELVRDTSNCVLLRLRAGLQTTKRPSLKDLSKSVLGRSIQTNTHCSVEDSIAAMDLYRSVEDEWENEKSDNSFYFDDCFWPEWIGQG